MKMIDLKKLISRIIFLISIVKACITLKDLLHEMGIELNFVFDIDNIHKIFDLIRNNRETIVEAILRYAKEYFDQTMAYIAKKTGIFNVAENYIEYNYSGDKYRIYRATNIEASSSISCARAKVKKTDPYYQDITNLMVKYHGPHYDFHGIKLTPQKLGYEEIVVELDDSFDDDIQFFSDQDIQF